METSLFIGSEKFSMACNVTGAFLKPVLKTLGIDLHSSLRRTLQLYVDSGTYVLSSACRPMLVDTYIQKKLQFKRFE